MCKSFGQIHWRDKKPTKPVLVITLVMKSFSREQPQNALLTVTRRETSFLSSLEIQLGSFSNDDGDDNDNGKNAIGLY